MRTFDELPPEWQQRITELADRAPPLSSRQRERLQQLLRGVAEEEAGE